MKRSYLGTLAVIGSIGIMAFVWYCGYALGYRNATNAAIVQIGNAFDKFELKLNLADSLRQCFEARPSLIPRKPKDTTWEVVGSFIEPTLSDSLVTLDSIVLFPDTSSYPTIEVDTNYWQRKPTLPDSLKPKTVWRTKPAPDTMYVDTCTFPERFGIYEERMRKDWVIQYVCDSDAVKPYLYTDSGLNWSALPFLFTSRMQKCCLVDSCRSADGTYWSGCKPDSSVIMLTTGALTGKKLRVLEWVQRPYSEPFNNEADSTISYRYRWSARVEGM